MIQLIQGENDTVSELATQACELARKHDDMVQLTFHDINVYVSKYSTMKTVMHDFQEKINAKKSPNS